MTSTNNNVTTGIEYESDVRDEDAQVYGFADDGGHAVVWAVWDDGDAYHVNVYNCEAGLADDVHAFTVALSQHENVDGLAQSLAEDDPEGSVQAAREYWNSK